MLFLVTHIFFCNLYTDEVDCVFPDETPEEEEIEHNWGEINKDNIVQVSESTRRLAVCNQDWDRIKAQDLMVILNSFKRAEGTIQSVKVTFCINRYTYSCLVSQTPKSPNLL